MMNKKKKKTSSYGGGGMVKKPKPMYAKKGGSVKSKKKFKAHMMYKGKKAVMAKTMADHLRLKKLGYTHSKPKK